MAIDLYTVLLILIVGCILQTIVMFWQTKINPSNDAIRFWLWGNIFLTLSVAALALRLFIDAPFLTIFLANLFVLVSEDFRYRGISIFSGRKINYKLLLALYAAYIICFFYFTFIKINLGFRILGISTLISVLYGLILRDLIKRKTTELYGSRYFLIGIMVINIIFNVIRIVTFPYQSSSEHFFYTTFQAVYFIGILFVCFLWTLGIAVMTGQKAQYEVVQAKKRFEIFFQMSPDFSFITEMDTGKIVEANERFIQASEYEKKEILGESIQSLLIWASNEDRERYMNAIARQGYCDNMMMDARSKNGNIYHTLISSKPMEVGQTAYLLSVARDVTERRSFEKRLEILSKAIEYSSVAVGILGRHRKLEYVNEQFSVMSGYTKAEMLGTEPIARLFQQVSIAAYERLWEVANTGAPAQEELLMQRKDGATYWEHVKLAPILDDDKNIQTYVAVVEDITERRNLEHELQRQAKTDALTNLYNRRHFIFCMQEVLSTYYHSAADHVFMIFDLDLFKQVNDTYGHVLGDQALQLVAATCLLSLRPSDLIGRIGGEEFAVFLPDLTLDKGLRVAEKLRRSVEEAVLVSSQQKRVQITISIGLTNYKMGDTFQQMLGRADYAMYTAKAEGRNCVRFVDIQDRNNECCELR